MKQKKIMAVVTASLVLIGGLLPAGQASASVPAKSLVKNAEKLIGTPYKYGGTSTSGFDCSGFVRYVFNKQSISLPRTADQMYRSSGHAVSRSALRAGDLVFFKTSGSDQVSHAGLYIGNGKFIHSSTSHGVGISSLNDPYYWGSRFAGARRI
ncbi:C40 family peptidase, partial [Aneurinibacillus terranovensis]|uniref:C40 family peptidase n=1 Tax=Aneurinibacillus terranovensis TaxID=278991 RepID=UPI000412764B